MSRLIDINLRVTLSELADLSEHHADLQDKFENEIDELGVMTVNGIIEAIDDFTLEFLISYLEHCDNDDPGFIDLLEKQAKKKWERLLE